jgi:hypothetical protein
MRMASKAFGVDANTVLDTPTEFGLETLANNELASLLSDVITGVSFTYDDQARNSRELRLTVTYTDGAPVITTPFLIKVFQGRTADEAAQHAQDFMDAHTTYFFSGVFNQVLTNTARRSTIVYALVMYNTSAADGATHYAGSGTPAGGSSPTGPAGGDLAGTYPDPTLAAVTHGYAASGAIPAAITTLLSVPVAAQQDVEAEIVHFTGNTRYSFTIRANIADGTTPEWLIDGIAIAPPSGGTFDFTISCDISGGNLRIRVTPATTGWAARTSAQELAV